MDMPTTHGVSAGSSKRTTLARNIDTTFELMKHAYNELKKENEELRHQTAKYKNDLVIATQRREAIAAECEQLHQQWVAHLDDSAKELQNIQAQMIPVREIHMMKLQMQQEIEEPHRKRVEELKAEMHKYRDQLFKEHRNAQLHQTRLEQAEEEHRREMEELMRRHDSTVHELMEKNQGLQKLAQTQDSDLKAKTRTLERDNAALHIRLKSLTEEADQLRKSAEESDRTVMHQGQRMQRAAQEAETKLHAAQNDARGLKVRCEALTQELQRAQEQASTVHARCLSLEQNVQTLTMRLRSSEDEVRVTKDSAAKRELEAQSMYQQEMRIAHERVHKAEEQMQEAVGQQQSLQAQLDSALRKGVESVKKAQEEESKKIWTLEQERLSLKERINQLERSNEEQHEAQKQEVSTLRRDLDGLRETHRNVVMERDRLSERLEQSKQDSAQLKSDFQTRLKLYSELENEYQTLQKKHRSLLEHSHAAEASREKAMTEAEYLRSEMEALQREVQQSQESHTETLRNTRESLTAELASHQARLAELDEELKRGENTTGEAVARVKKEKNKYKRMSLLLRARLNDIAKENSASKKDLLQMLQTKTTENRALSQQLREAEQQRDELKLRLSMGGMSGQDLSTPALAAVDNSTHSEIQQLLDRLQQATLQAGDRRHRLLGPHAGALTGVSDGLNTDADAAEENKQL